MSDEVTKSAIDDFLDADDSISEDDYVDNVEEMMSSTQETQEEEGTEEEDVPEEGPEEEPDELTSLKEQNEALIKQLNSINENLHQQRSETQPVQEQEPAQPKVSTEPIDFLRDTPIDDLIDDPKKFNDMLNSIYQKAREDAIAESTQHVLQSIPQMTMKYVHSQFNTRKAIDNFWGEHPQLKEARVAVGAIANTVDIEHPEWDMGKKLEETAQRAYKMLGISKGAMKRAKRGNPSLPGTSNKKATKPNANQLSKMQREIQEMISLEGV